MKRLAAMQDWPLLIVRALTAVDAAASRSALGITMNGSLPPSSSTHFLIWAPAVRPTETPAPSLPVSVTAAIAGILDQLRDAVGADEERLEGAFREPGLAEDLLDRERAVGHVRGVLEQSHVSGHRARARRNGRPARTESSRASPRARGRAGRSGRSSGSRRSGPARRTGSARRFRRSSGRPRRTSRLRRRPRRWACPSRASSAGPSSALRDSRESRPRRRAARSDRASTSARQAGSRLRRARRAARLRRRNAARSS